ncbi:FAD binding domain-containing protein [Vararia minispora EC-137]|uniref:FAD binding domain-containing protein n=1 Tax=Vararia minispora EC-137 TaxID=1314806 RepID=A0ACB8QV10_9AGAM|nr:FAD binding domain-containing protein [Vararia minispora EC-137]
MVYPHFSQEHVDVLVIGAGPAGLMCALGLLRAGVKVKIIDKRAQKVAVGQADGIMPRTIEVFETYGLKNALFDLGVFLYKQFTKSFSPVAMLDARYKVFITICQGMIEDIFITALRNGGVVVDRSLSPVAIDISPDVKALGDPSTYPITATLERTDGIKGSIDVRAKFIVGADGAHSWVRQALGIVMEGKATPRVWGAVDFRPSSQSDFPDWRVMTIAHTPTANAILIPRENDLVRLYGELGFESQYVDPSTGRVDLSHFKPETILGVTRTAFRPYLIEPASDKDIQWWTVYSIGQRIASAYSVHGRAFITGDACHTHSPKAAQGMNAAINDSHNLAWKLALVIRGHAKMPLLETYESERRAFGKELIAFDKWYADGFSSDANQELQETLGVNVGGFAGLRAFIGMLSGCETRYAPSDVVYDKPTGATALLVGARLPPCPLMRTADSAPADVQDTCPSDGRFKVLAFCGKLVDDADIERLQKLGQRVSAALEKTSARDVVSVVSILERIDESKRYSDVPCTLRSHWKSVLEDTVGPPETVKIYKKFGIGEEGALVVVRPDGHVAATATVEEVQVVEEFFSKILVAPAYT